MVAYICCVIVVIVCEGSWNSRLPFLVVQNVNIPAISKP